MALAASTQLAGGQLVLTETQITTNQQEQWNSAIYGDRIVWTDSRNVSHYDIYMYNLSTKKETKITNSESSSTEPAIYEDKIVWMDYRNGNCDIYLYNISTGKETQITTNKSDQFSPDIYGDNIVWYDWRNGNSEIYMYNLSTYNETRITNFKSYKVDPTIYGDRIVWMDMRNGNWDIYMYNISTSNETQVTFALSDQYSPAIYKDRVIWNNYYSIFIYNISTSNVTQIATTTGKKEYPAIYGDKIVWTDTRNVESNDPLDIYMYDLSTSIETRVTTNMSLQSSPDIYEDRIVWTDWRNGPGDIYMATLNYLPTASFSANPTLGASPLEVSFNDTSKGTVTGWNWSFGDGTYSTYRNLTHTYVKAGNYTVNFTASNENVINSTTQEITVLEEGFPVSNFKTNLTNGYVPLAIQFTDFSQNAALRIWDFNNDGISDSNNVNPIYEYTVPGTYFVNFTVSNAKGNASKLSAITAVTRPQYSLMETKVTTDKLSREDAANYRDTVVCSIYDDRIVWNEYSYYGNLDIYMYDLSTSKETQLTNDESDQVNPVIYGERIVWRGHSNESDDDIYMYNISTSTEARITTNKAKQLEPDIYGDRIVYHDWRNGNSDIYMYDLSTSIETQITTNKADQYCPSIYEDKIVWYDNRNGGDFDNYGQLSGNWDIYMYDLSTQKEIQITANESSQTHPEIYGNRIVWSDYRNNNYNIYMYNLSTKRETQVTTSGTAEFPDIYRNKIVWFDYRNGEKWNNHDIYMYDISTSKEIQITAVDSYKVDPNIYGDRIVWYDNRNQNSNIYMCTIEDNLDKIGSNDSETDSNSNGEKTEDNETNKSNIRGSSVDNSNGKGGGAGSSTEPAKNVKAKELSQTFITSGKPVKFDFPRNATSVVNLTFDSRTTVGKTTTVIEMLKSKSVLTPDVPTGEVYNYLNIWVGNGGYGTKETIENAVIYFKVEKSWIQDKRIDRASITLERYNGKKWNGLPTTLHREDDKYLYFTAETPGFSFFAITANAVVKETSNEIRPESYTESSKNKTGSTVANVEQIPEKKKSITTPGFEVVYEIIGLLGVFLRNKKC